MEDIYFLEKFLKLESSLWYDFQVKCMMSVSHTSDVQKEMVIYVYALMQDIPIGVGKLLFSKIQMCINSDHIALFFPTIITELCQGGGNFSR